ncbi:ornithine cyclodeaminase family protein [Ancylobacter defluvii]|uniref:Ornithine cyclodeaminase n=1 Tax=Ancylobacter defluvii TaxID=1282440 RepID=A0A9W6K074_9HYPH|nr:ornithine cyclodeaminase family protein [Ancylobacter defluvii]MBS7589528.1 ornithine cyclodeaminase family protein [Ancylobacter defluvii]GLK85144.1 ornithine cyclodeaminase [Ancylobacter defluvii]
MRFYATEEIEAALDYPRLVAALREAFASHDEPMPVRGAFDVGTPTAPGHLLTMPAWKRGEAIGTKLVTVFPNNSAHGLGAVGSLYALFDGITGQPRAVMEGDALTNRRTAAASALAASWLARPDSHTLLLVGTGHVAAQLAQAHRAVRPIERVLVWGRRGDKAEALAAAIGTSGVEARAVSDLATAVGEADIVSCATTSTAPLVKGADVRPGTHIDLVGAFNPAMRESDDALVQRAEVFVDTRAGALAEAGDLLQPMRAGLWSAEALRADLHDLARGRHPGRRTTEEITLFKSVGAALEDLAAARLVVGD